DGGTGQVDEVFRRAHSLKGAARLAGLQPAETVAHRLESLFARVREGAQQLTTEMLRAIHRGLDFIEDAAASLFEGRSCPDAADVLRIIEVGDAMPTITVPPSPPAASP